MGGGWLTQAHVAFLDHWSGKYSDGGFPSALTAVPLRLDAIPGAMATRNSMAAAGGQATPSFLTSKQKRERGQKWNAPILADSCSLSAPVALLGLFCHTKTVARPDQRIRIVGSYYFLMGVCARRRPSPAPVCSARSLPILNRI